MTFTYDVATDSGVVRLLSTDTDEAGAIFDDDEIAALLTLQGGDVKLAAAQALDIIASSEALVQKKIRLLDLQTDGPAVAKALRDHAAELREQVAVGDAIGAFDIGEMVVNEFTARDRWHKQWLRQLG